ncbi:MAG: hypothetical protein HY001_00785 [Candidatus Portnoybacteria bacterium]|nr:hypothetical protein [Candidatus Portnoybacteria bacterium]
MNKFLQSKRFKVVLVAIGALIVLLFVFKVGVFVGYKKAGYSYRWGENYHKNFAGPRGGFFGDFERGFGDKDFINAYGIFGSVIKIDGDTIIMKSRDGVEEIVLVSDGTVIRRGRETLKISDLKADDLIVVLGSPNDQGQIEAKFIRLFGDKTKKESPDKCPSYSRFFKWLCFQNYSRK